MAWAKFIVLSSYEDFENVKQLIDSLQNEGGRPQDFHLTPPVIGLSSDQVFSAVRSYMLQNKDKAHVQTFKLEEVTENAKPL